MKKEISITTLMYGNIVHVTSSTSTGIVVSDQVYCGQDLSDSTVEGIPVTYKNLKTFLDFENRIIKVDKNPAQEGMIKAVDADPSYYIILIDFDSSGQYRMRIDVNGTNIFSSRVEYIHQVQSLFTTLTGLNING